MWVRSKPSRMDVVRWNQPKGCTMQLNPYLLFNGQWEAAFKFEDRRLIRIEFTVRTRDCVVMSAEVGNMRSNDRSRNGVSDE
jgi:hypothetical protein